MKVHVFAVYDKALKAYHMPFYTRTAEEAVRSVRTLARRSDHDYALNQKDFELHYLAVWDDASGVFEPAVDGYVWPIAEMLEDDGNAS